MTYCCVCKFKQAIYNFSDLKAKYCGKCKLNDMIDVFNKKCVVCNIKRSAFNYSTETKPSYCGDCKLDNMINGVSKKCTICKIKIPNFNYAGEKIASHCVACKTDDMIDIKNKRCVVCGIKQPIFNYYGEKRPSHCGDCKLNDMINIKNKKCIICKIKIPIFNYSVEKIASHCNDCKLDDMIDVKHRKCSICNINRANPKHKTLCSTCYRFLNPNEPAFRNYKIKENTIMKFVKDKYPDIILDSVISGGCSKRRPDGLLEFELFSIIIEIDEDAHRSYEDICENKRLMEIYKDLGFRPLRVIRFNPDSYTDANNKKISSIFSIEKESKKLKVKSKKELGRRVQILLETIEKIVDGFNIEDKSIALEYLFFNEN